MIFEQQYITVFQLKSEQVRIIAADIPDQIDDVIVAASLDINVESIDFLITALTHIKADQE